MFGVQCNISAADLVWTNKEILLLVKGRDVYFSISVTKINDFGTVPFPRKTYENRYIGLSICIDASTCSYSGMPKWMLAKFSTDEP